jgi:AsmA protein
MSKPALERLQHLRPYLRAILTWRVAVLVGLVLLVFAGGQRLLGTLFVSSGMVRQQIHEAVRSQTGLEFLVSGETSVSFWPSPMIALRDVDILKPGSGKPDAIMHADLVTGRFDVISALTGSPQFNAITLTHPTFRVVRSSAGRFAWQAAASPDGENHTPLDDLHLGRIRLQNGTFEFRQEDGPGVKLEALDGSFEFSSLSKALSFSFTSTAGQKPLSVSGSLLNPGLWLDGDNSGLSVRLSSDGMDASFTGTSNIGERGFVSGTMEASATDAGEVANWVGLGYPVLDKLKVVDLKASVASEGLKFTFADLKLQLTDHQATGILSAGWNKRNAPPFLSGTLAFDRFDAGGFLTAFVPPVANPWQMPLTIDTRFLHEFQVDLRLSATKASFGALSVSDMAAGVRVVDGHASFAVASGQIANGTVSADISIDEDLEKGTLCKLVIQGRGVDLGAIPGMLGVSGPWPQATGSLEIDLHSRLPAAPSGHAETSGSVKVSGGPGKLVGFDAEVFRELASQKRFFDLSQASATPLPIESFDLSAVIDNGIAELNHATFKSASGNLDLTGVVPYKNNSLAVSGTLSPAAGANAPATRFFAGGAWPNILISPFSAVMSGQ